MMGPWASKNKSDSVKGNKELMAILCYLLVGRVALG